MDIQCSICNEKFYTYRTFSIHIIKTHNIKTKDYYDMYLKRPGEGVCQVCPNETVYRSISEGYKETCSVKCRGILFSKSSDKIKIRNTKTKLTVRKKYGVDNVFQCDNIKSKSKNTCLTKWGVEYFSQSDAHTEKMSITNLARYGTSTYLHSNQGAIQVKNTMLERYGTDNYAKTQLFKDFLKTVKFTPINTSKNYAIYGVPYYTQTDEFKQKSKSSQILKYGSMYSSTPEYRTKVNNTNKTLYGTEHYFKSCNFKEKSIATLISKYGVDNYAKTDNWKQKYITTCNALYDSDFYITSDDFKIKSKETNNRLYGSDNYFTSDTYKHTIINKYKDTLSKVSCTVIDVTPDHKIVYTCMLCNHINTEQYQFAITYRMGNNQSPCVNCLPKNPYNSSEELSLADFIHELGFEYKTYNSGFLGRYGADIVIESKKLIIEYDGLHWHSELYKDKNYHMRKTEIAESMGYRLIHIFSDEWIYKKDIVKSRLSSILGKSQTRIFARKCNIQPVDFQLSSTFLEGNHIQGSCKSSLQYGLFMNNELMALMTFGKSRFKDGEYELIRYCNKLNTNVIGGASKLFSHFLKETNITDVISFADRRWSSAQSMYTSIGFVKEYITEPAYFYVNNDTRESRMKYQKHILVSQGFDESKTEHQIMLDRGLYRIYDVGHFKYKFTKI